MKGQFVSWDLKSLAQKPGLIRPRLRELEASKVVNWTIFHIFFAFNSAQSNLMKIFTSQNLFIGTLGVCIIKNRFDLANWKLQKLQIKQFFVFFLFVTVHGAI